MKVADIMQPKLQTTHPEATIADAVTTLADAHVLGLPVVDHEGRLVGVLSTTDVLEAVAETSTPRDRENVFERTQVGDLMTPDPMTIDAEAELKDAAQRMLYLDVHRLFVVENEQLVGVVAQSDLVRAFATGGAKALHSSQS